MLDSIGWGTWDQLQWRGANDAPTLEEAQLIRARDAVLAARRQLGQARSGNSSEWRKSKRGTEVTARRLCGVALSICKQEYRATDDHCSWG